MPKASDKSYGAIDNASSSGNDGQNVTEETPLVAKNEETGDSPGGDSTGKKGSASLSMSQAAILIAGEMAGSGILALPRALVKTGWLGVPVILLMCAIAAYSGKKLAQCWTILEERNPEMRTRKRNPYTLIAYHTLGKNASIAVSMCIQVTLFGAGVVYLLLAASIIRSLFLTLVPTVTFCSWFLIITLLVTPTIWYGTPKNFRFIGLIAFFATVLACIFYFIQMLNEIPFYPVFRFGLHGFQDFFLAFGTILFVFGGASTFPTIQNDMADKKQFSKSIMYAFIAILLLYLPLTIGAYAIYGERITPNIATTFKATPLTLIGNVMMVIHLLSAFVIITNPVCQELEELFNVPREFQWRHVALRTGVMAAVLFIGESIPNFSTILALVGGSTVALLTFILPSYCYMKLRTENVAEADQPPAYFKLLSWQIILIGVLGGIAATFSAFSAIFSTQLALPCYV